MHSGKAKVVHVLLEIILGAIEVVADILRRTLVGFGELRGRNHTLVSPIDGDKFFDVHEITSFQSFDEATEAADVLQIIPAYTPPPLSVTSKLLDSKDCLGYNNCTESFDAPRVKYWKIFSSDYTANRAGRQAKVDTSPASKGFIFLQKQNPAGAILRDFYLSSSLPITFLATEANARDRDKQREEFKPPDDKNHRAKHLPERRQSFEACGVAQARQIPDRRQARNRHRHRLREHHAREAQHRRADKHRHNHEEKVAQNPADCAHG